MARKLVSVIVIICISTAAAMAGEEGFVKLFNGKDLAGWEAKDDIWSVRDGMIVGKARPPRLKHNSFLTTTKEFQDFELRLEFHLVDGKGNSGVQYRSKRFFANSHEVSGYQADLGDNYWGVLYDEARRNRVLQRPIDPQKLKKVLKRAGWNTYVIRAEGNHLTQFINGVKTIDYIEKDAGIARKGIIGLQVHSGPPVEMQFRNIRIEEL